MLDFIKKIKNIIVSEQKSQSINSPRYTLPLTIQYQPEEKEKDFIDRLKRAHAIPDSIEVFNDINPFTIDKEGIDNLDKFLGNEERVISQQSLNAFAFRGYTLSMMGCARILDKVVGLLLKKENIPNPVPLPIPENANSQICHNCKIHNTYTPGLRAKIEELRKSNNIEIPIELIEIIKKLSQSAKHPNTVFDCSEATYLLSNTVYLLKRLNK